MPASGRDTGFKDVEHAQIPECEDVGCVEDREGFGVSVLLSVFNCYCLTLVIRIVKVYLADTAVLGIARLIFVPCCLNCVQCPSRNTQVLWYEVRREGVW